MLQAWSPPDPAAQALLLPWKQVWSTADWTDITKRTVVPALEAAMHHVLNLLPQSLNTAPCEWCSAWVNLLSVKQLSGVYEPCSERLPLLQAILCSAASVLLPAWGSVSLKNCHMFSQLLTSGWYVGIYERGFFPKLHHVLHYWLMHSAQVNFSEVSEWLSEKKQMCIPPALQHDPAVLHQLASAAGAVAEFEQNHVLPPGYPNVAAFEAATAARRAADDAAMREHLEEKDKFTAKDILEDLAQQASLTFMPRHGRMENGLQVYAVGKLSVYFDLHVNSAVKAYVVDRWVPMGVEEIVQLALKQNISR